MFKEWIMICCHSLNHTNSRMHRYAPKRTCVHARRQRISLTIVTRGRRARTFPSLARDAGVTWWTQTAGPVDVTRTGARVDACDVTTFCQCVVASVALETWRTPARPSSTLVLLKSAVYSESVHPLTSLVAP